LDASSKSYFVRKISLPDVTTFKLDLNKGIATGKYFIRVQREEDDATQTLSFIKEYFLDF
jgi:hypothetical protein